MGLGRQKQRQITKRFYSNTVALSTWKINKMRLVRMAEKGSKTTLHRSFTESVRKKTYWRQQSSQKTQTFGRQWLYIEERQVTGRNTDALRVAKVKSSLHTSQYAGGVPSDHGQRQALVEPLSLRGVAWNGNEFLCETAQEGSVDLPYTPVVSIASGWK